MSRLKNEKTNFILLFVAICHMIIFNHVFTRDEFVQNSKNKIKNKQPTCLFYA
ncbi:hypothetical protein ACWOFR_16165 [Carnobacterium gallinarum]|uniref:hypothetical protein n=1 Tax=Carnobacterium gallinarum TaxID=2749 RepID=UPI0012FBFD8D|nr:hypothetical protein [Carnobacterium gallinarum]